jgi:hypothetical protein
VLAQRGHQSLRIRRGFGLHVLDHGAEYDALAFAGGVGQPLLQRRPGPGGIDYGHGLLLLL